MVKKLFAALLLIITIFIAVVTPAVIRAEITPTPDTSSQKVDEVKRRIKELEAKITDAQSTEKTLKSQIQTIDTQIELTRLKINATEQEISELNKDITTTTGKISDLENSLEKITKVLLRRIVLTYEQGSNTQAQIFVSASNFTDYFTKMNYLHIIQIRDRKLLYETQQAKNDYANQKDIFEGKKKRVVALQVQLEAYKKQIDEEKAGKEELLRVTKNNEVEYQRLLSSAKAEMAAIEGVVSSLKFENGTPVKGGQIIAAVGNSGYPDCSTGAHLHFEIRTNNNIVNPANYLRSNVEWKYAYNSDTYSYYGTINPGGDWDWPLDQIIQINQAYGSHTYASRYAGGVHTGIDMESLSNDFIRSPKDGTLYRGSTTCGSSTLNYIAVDHGGGVVSWYWHVK